MQPLDTILGSHGVSFHFYADETLQCLEEVKAWPTQNFLFLNEDKTEVIVFGPNEHSQCISPELAFKSQGVWNLGGLVDQSLKFLQKDLIRNQFQFLPTSFIG